MSRWFLCCDDLIDHNTYVLGVFNELGDVVTHVARCYFDVPEKKLYVVRASDEEYWLVCPNRYKGTCKTVLKL